MEVIVIGGGIGGLALALMLGQRGIAVHVFEAAAEIRPLGVGINVQPSAVAELTMLRLLPQLDAMAVRTAQVSYYNRFGQHIWSEPRGTAAGYAVPQFSVHRGRLQLLLRDALVQRLGADVLRCGVQAVSVAPDDGIVRLKSRADGLEWDEQADLVVAADGIHSIVRRQFHPHEGPPSHSGRILWRGVTRGAPFLGGRTMVMCGHADHKLVAYPITPPDADGTVLLNWVAELKLPQRQPPKDDWNRQVPLETFAPAFESWRFAWLDVPALLAGAERVFEFPMVDRDPLPRWTRGRVTLLGDAAHPMYPIGSNGATQAILDGRALAGALAAAIARAPRDAPRHEVAAEALVAYEADRLPATARIVQANRGQGPDHVMQIVQERAPDGFEHIDDVASRDELLAVADQYKSLVGLEIASVNARVASWRARR